MTKELWHHIAPPARLGVGVCWWCPASTVQVFLDDGWTIIESEEA